MIFHENRLLKCYTLFFFQKLGNLSQNLLSVAAVIGALRPLFCLFLRGHFAQVLLYTSLKMRTEDDRWALDHWHTNTSHEPSHG